MKKREKREHRERGRLIRQAFKDAADSRQIERQLGYRTTSSTQRLMANSPMAVTAQRVVAHMLERVGGIRSWARSVATNAVERKAAFKALHAMMESTVIRGRPVEFVDRVRELLALCVQTRWGSPCLVYGYPVISTMLAKDEDGIRVKVALLRPYLKKYFVWRTLYISQEDAVVHGKPDAYVKRWRLPWHLNTKGDNGVALQDGDEMYPPMMKAHEGLELAAMLVVLKDLGNLGLIDAPLQPMGKKGYLEFDATFTGTLPNTGDHRSYRRLLEETGYVSDDIREVWSHFLSMQGAGEGGVVFDDQDHRDIESFGIKHDPLRLPVNLAKPGRRELAKAERPFGWNASWNCEAVAWDPRLGKEYTIVELRVLQKDKETGRRTQLWNYDMFPAWLPKQHRTTSDSEFDQRTRAAVELGFYKFRPFAREYGALKAEINKRTGRPMMRVSRDKDGKPIDPITWQYCPQCASTGQYRRWRLEKLAGEKLAPHSYWSGGRLMFASPFRMGAIQHQCVTCGNRLWRVAANIYIKPDVFEDLFIPGALPANTEAIRFMVFGDIVVEMFRRNPQLRIGEYIKGEPWYW